MQALCTGGGATQASLFPIAAGRAMPFPRRRQLLCAGQHALGNVGRGAEGRLSSIARAKVSLHLTLHLLSSAGEILRHAARSYFRPPNMIHFWESEDATRAPRQHLYETGRLLCTSERRRCNGWNVSVVSVLLQ